MPAGVDNHPPVMHAIYHNKPDMIHKLARFGGADLNASFRKNLPLEYAVSVAPGLSDHDRDQLTRVLADVRRTVSVFLLLFPFTCS
jgi:hypothetical protein